jgi:hypothetical protein
MASPSWLVAGARQIAAWSDVPRTRGASGMQVVASIRLAKPHVGLDPEDAETAHAIGEGCVRHKALCLPIFSISTYKRIL